MLSLNIAVPKNTRSWVMFTSVFHLYYLFSKCINLLFISNLKRFVPLHILLKVNRLRKLSSQAAILTPSMCDGLVQGDKGKTFTSIILLTC